MKKKLRMMSSLELIQVQTSRLGHHTMMKTHLYWGKTTLILADGLSGKYLISHQVREQLSIRTTPRLFMCLSSAVDWKASRREDINSKEVRELIEKMTG